MSSLDSLISTTISSHTYSSHSTLSPLLNYQQLHCTEAATIAFTAIKEALATATLLMHPNLDAPSSSVTVNASDKGVGAALQQRVDCEWYPLFPDAQFDKVHLDIAGPLSYSQCFTYLLTCIDHFTRWPEAIPTTDITTQHTQCLLIAMYVWPSINAIYLPTHLWRSKAGKTLFAWITCETCSLGTVINSK